MTRLTPVLVFCLALIACGGEEKQSGPQPGGPGPAAPGAGAGPGTAKPPTPGPDKPDLPPPPPPPPEEEVRAEKMKKIQRLLGSSDEENRLEGLGMLTELEDKKVAGGLAVDALKDENVDVRETAVRMILDLDYTQGEENLKMLIRREKSDLVRKVALQTLHELTGGRVASELIRALESDPSDSVKALAATLLGESKDERAGGALIKALGDFDPGVRRNALVSLQKLRPKGAAKKVAEFLEDMSLEVRTEAARTLGALGEKVGVAPLIAFLEEEESLQALQHATDSLGELTGRANTFDERADEEKRTAALEAWAAWWEENRGDYE